MTGLQDPTWEDLDGGGLTTGGVIVSPGGVGDGAVFDVRHSSTLLWAELCSLIVSAENTGTTDGYEFEVYVKWSEDSSAWSDDQDGTFLFYWKVETGGADMTRSEPETVEPRGRFGRLRFKNLNASDPIAFRSRLAKLYRGVA